jgi:hypothetical protein
VITAETASCARVHEGGNHDHVFRRPAPEPLLSRTDLDGVIMLLMSIDEGIRRIVRAVEEDDGEEEEEAGS